MDASPWDGFVDGPENALARAGAVALARGDDLAVAPLLVQGAAGVGKSRLLRGLVGEWLRRRPEAAVAALDGESFAAACAEAAGDRDGWAELRGRFRSVDLFVLDDLDGLGRAPLALAELGHTLDALIGCGAGVAVASRTGPAGWEGWPSRLVSRLVGGLSARIDPPGPDSRRRFLLDRARGRGARLPAEVVDAVVEAAEGYRELEGWLVRLELAARVERRAPDAGLVAALGAGDGPEAAGASELLGRIGREVAGRFGVALRDLRAATRRRAVAEPRHLAMFLARQRTGLSFARIGRYFGGRDPATVRHACRVAAARLDADPALAAAVAAMAARWPTPGRASASASAAGAVGAGPD